MMPDDKIIIHMRKLVVELLSCLVESHLRILITGGSGKHCTVSLFIELSINVELGGGQDILLKMLIKKTLVNSDTT
jgi:hypothetical protein